MDIFIYTYAGDAALLPLCLEYAARAGRVVLVDDAAAPATDAAGALAMGAAEYVRSEFERRGNLNGAACVRGMLETYRDHGSASWIMQLDSDMLLFAPHVLQPREDSAVAMVGKTVGYSDACRRERPVLYACGGGMLLRRDMVAPMLALVDRPDIVSRIENGKGFSDHVLTVLCRMCGGDVELLRYEGAELVDGVYRRVGWWRFGEDNTLCEHAAAVHVRPENTPGNTPEERAAAVLSAMRQVAQNWSALEVKTNDAKHAPQMRAVMADWAECSIS